MDRELALLKGGSALFLTDYHTHTLCSPDSSAPLAQMAQAALDTGLSELCTTDHCDLLTLDGKPDDSFQWEDIDLQLSQARVLFDGRLPIRLGLELGEAWEDLPAAREIVDHPGLDLVLGSVHNLSSAAGGGDFYFMDYREEATCFAVLDDYFHSMSILAGLDCCDVLAHIIYPLRYMERDGAHISLSRYEEQLRSIFRTAIDLGKGIEVNTCRGQNIEDWRDILATYKDCGGEILTLGSDAHAPADVGRGIPAAARLVKEMGFTYVAAYENRQPKFVKL